MTDGRTYQYWAGLEYKLGEKGAFAVLRAGYTMSVGNSEWQSNGYSLSDSPDASLEGPYLHLTIGWSTWWLTLDQESSWIQGKEYRLKIEVFQRDTITEHPVLIIVLYGDAPFKNPDYQYLLFFLVSLLAINRYLSSTWGFPSGDDSIWFHSGLLILIIGSYWIEHHFSMPSERYLHGSNKISKPRYRLSRSQYCF